MGDVDELQDINLYQVGSTGEIELPPIARNVEFKVVGTILKFLQLKGLFGGQDHEAPHEHLWNFVDVCLPFKYWGVTQEAIRLRLFPFSIIREAMRFLADFLKIQLHHGMNYKMCSLKGSSPPPLKDGQAIIEH